MINVKESDFNRVCDELLSDCFLNIEFESTPFIVRLVFISNVDRKKIIVKCGQISKFLIEKNANEGPFYSILETKIMKADSEWIINVVPNIDATIICKEFAMTIEELSNQQLIKLGLINPH